MYYKLLAVCPLPYVWNAVGVGYWRLCDDQTWLVRIIINYVVGKVWQRTNLKLVH